METEFNEDKIRRELKIDARGLGIPSGAANSFIDRVIKATKKAIKDKPAITENDLIRIISKELEKYNPDFAYVYRNRGKMI